MSAVSNARWVALSQAVKVGSQLANMLVLTRLIEPTEYGLMAMAGIATNLAMLLRDMGTAAAIVQKETLSQSMTTSIFWLNMMMGVLLCILTAVLAPVMSVVFEAPALTPVLLLLSLSFPIASSAAAHQALLERASNFRVVAYIESFASLLSLVVAVVAALHGWGVYSLVVQALMAAVVSSALIWKKSAWRPDLHFNWAELKAILGFSGNMAGYQLTSYLFRNADAFIVGKYLGAAVLGVYSLAYKVMLFPVQNISWVSTRALFPVMSRMQGDKGELGRLFLKVISFLSFITAPLMFGLMVSADVFTQAAFTHQWAGMADMLSLMCMVGYLQVISGATGPVLMALGKSALLFKIAIFGAVVHLAFFWWGTRFGGVGVAGGYLLASCIVNPVTLLLTARILDLSFPRVLRAIQSSFIGAVLMAGVLLLAKHAAPAGWTAPSLLLALTVLGITAYGLFSVLVQRQQFSIFRSMMILKRGV